MGYRRALLLRWSRRDRLAILVVAVTVAFLVGTTLLVFAAGSQTTAIAAEFDAPGFAASYDSPDAARAAAPDGAIVLPIAEMTLDDGSESLVLGRPPEGNFARGLGLTETGTTSGSVDEPTTLALDGRGETVTVDAEPRSGSILPARWVLTDRETVERLGPTGAVALWPADGGFDGGVPLRAALVFFVLGTEQALSVLSVAAVGAGLLVAVTVYSVTRMSVRDRTRAIRVIRSTGGTPRDVLALFGVRAALLSGLGVALGYAIGVIVPSAAASIAVTAGLPTALDVSVSARAARTLAPLLAGTFAVGAIAGVLAARPAVHRPPSHLNGPAVRTDGDPSTVGLGSRFGGDVLGWRPLVPTTATLTAFVLFAALVVAAVGVVGPLAAADATTVTSPDAAHPFASSVPEAYADAIRAHGEAASPEILLFGAIDGRPFAARGAHFEAFANVTPARLESGRAPDGTEEAAIGVDLARTLDVSVGQSILLGGSTHAGLARVRVVGTYSAPGPFDDQLVVSLSTARHLADRSADRVHFVRASGLPDDVDVDSTGDDGVVDVTAPDRLPANGSATVRVTLRNDGPEAATLEVPVALDDDERRVTVTLSPGEERTEAVTFDVDRPGDRTLRVGDRERTIRVVDPDAIEIALPDRAPTGSRPLVRVVDGTGAPENATVTVGNRTVRTGSDGRARLRLDSPGDREVSAERGNRSATTTVRVSDGASRELDGRLAIRPNSPTLFVRPKARLTLSNPWNVTRSGRATIEGSGGRLRQNVSIPPGERMSVVTRFDRQPPGTYTVEATFEGREVASTEYAVTGDERIAAALAASGRTGGTGAGRAIETAFGNLRLVLGAVIALAGLMAIGGTTAAFAGAVHARRRTIGVHRATGAGPGRLLRLVLADALRVGSVATVLAIVLGLAVLRGLDAAGHLVVFGVDLSPTPSPRVLLAIGAGALVLTLLSAALALVGLLVSSPAALLNGDRAPGTGDRG